MLSSHELLSPVDVADETMPIKSKAQRRKFAQLLTEGKITEEVFERWNREAGSAELPEHIDRKAKKRTAKKKSRTRRKK